MRLFIGIELSMALKEKLHELQRVWLSYAYEKNPTSFDNFHLTLKFLGQIDVHQIPDIEDAMSDTLKRYSSFSFVVDSIGTFKRGQKEILWAGMSQYSKELDHIHRSLHHAMVDLGIPNLTQNFKPHITVAREVHFRCGETIKLPLLNHEEMVNGITLFISKRVLGSLIYEPIYTHALKK